LILIFRKIMAGGVLAPLLWLALCAGTGITAVRAATERVIYRFQGGADGAVPLAGLTSIGGTLYGTTEEGGINCDVGCGTVFALAPPAVPGGAWTETVIYRFTGYYDGALPEAGLVAIGGTLYGTTLEGGRAGGTVFALLPPQSGGTAWTENVLYAFSGGSDGSYPNAELLDVNGTLYGTTSSGGLQACGGFACGTVFALTPPSVPGGGWSMNQLYAFAGGSDAAHPVAGLTRVGGELVGTTYAGGAFGAGTVFAVRPPDYFSTSQKWTETVLHSFAGGADGSTPFASVLNVGGTIFGTTYLGGASGDGTVFELSRPSGSSVWSESVLYSFANGRGRAGSGAGLVQVFGLLYGTDVQGGGSGCQGSGCGQVFSLAPPGVGGGAWAETDLYDFAGGTDGAVPESNLIRVGGSLYGTTSRGGGTGCAPFNGCGTVFEVTP
jgi:uncharacterized repeat protein (TIGR03803 family)